MRFLADEGWAELLYGFVAVVVIGVSLYSVNSARVGTPSMWETWREQQPKQEIVVRQASNPATVTSQADSAPLLASQ